MSAFVDRLIELGEDARVVADLNLGQPLASEPVHPGLAIAREYVERAQAAEIGREPHAEAQVVGTPGLLARLDQQDALAVFLRDPVTDALEIAPPVDTAQVGGNFFFGERLARL